MVNGNAQCLVEEEVEVEVLGKLALRDDVHICMLTTQWEPVMKRR